MCTLTIVPRAGGVRLGMNRDEQRTRAVALPPDVRRVGRTTAVFPVDPESGGTWIGVNEFGMAMALLNRSDDGSRPPKRRALRSRGTIIPSLLGCSNIDAVLDSVSMLDDISFDPFRLVIVQGGQIVVVRSSDRARDADAATTRLMPRRYEGEMIERATAAVTCRRDEGHAIERAVQVRTARRDRSVEDQRVTITLADLRHPVMFTSSSLGDEAARRVRQPFFAQMMAADSDRWLEMQARFHAHRGVESPAFSVTMARPDARTVSRTWIDVGPGRITCWYESLEDAAWIGEAA